MPARERTFSMWDLVALWIGLVVCIPSWFLATSLVDLGAPPLLVPLALSACRGTQASAGTTSSALGRHVPNGCGHTYILRRAPVLRFGLSTPLIVGSNPEIGSDWAQSLPTDRMRTMNPLAWRRHELVAGSARGAAGQPRHAGPHALVRPPRSVLGHSSPTTLPVALA